MQSALVRKDAVMLHDPMRTHQRSTIIGVVTAAVGILGFLVFGVIKPAPSLPDSGIVISQQSGAVYVVAGNPKKLIPATNMASAKLLLMAMGGGSSANSAPSVVDENAMQGTPRDKLTGIFGAPDLLPTKDQLITPNWAVCDDARPAANQPSQQKNDARPTTTVLGGVSALGRELGPKQALLVSATKDETWMVYRAPRTAVVPSGTTVVRAKVDTSDAATVGAVLHAYGLPGLSPRQVSPGLLNAIPQVRTIGKPKFTGALETVRYNLVIGNANAKVGQVFKVSGNTDEYYVALQDGIKQISPSAAQLVQATNGLLQKSIDIAAVGDITPLNTSSSGLALDDYPASPDLEVLDTTKAPVACFSWSPKDNQEQTTLTIPSNVPLPNGMQAVQLANAGTDLVFLPPGHAAVVQSAKSPDDFGRGPIYLVSDRGVKFGIPDAQTTGGLGLGNQFDPAPESIIRLLPAGPALNQDDAQRQYDAVTTNDTVGTLPAKKPTAQAGG
jgi:type VII secretion protein EccB